MVLLKKVPEWSSMGHQFSTVKDTVIVKTAKRGFWSFSPPFPRHLSFDLHCSFRLDLLEMFLLGSL